MKVVFTAAALADLDEILGYTSEHYPAQAGAAEQRIRAVIARVGELPESGRRVEARPGVRMVPLIRYPFLIFYRIVDERVELLHIHHAARRPGWSGSVVRDKNPDSVVRSRISLALHPGSGDYTSTMTMDVEAEIRDLKRRVSELEGSFGFLTEQVKGVHRDLLAFQERTEQRFDKVGERFDKVGERFDKVDGRLDRMDGRIGRVEAEVRQLREDMPVIVGDAVREVLREGKGK